MVKIGVEKLRQDKVKFFFFHILRFSCLNTSNYHKSVDIDK